MEEVTTSGGVQTPPASQPQTVSQDDIKSAGETIEAIRGAFGKVVIGQAEMLESILVSILAEGHLLIEGVPGLAKTTAVRAVAQSLGATFVRIQCTPDMLPSDIIGTQIYNQQEHSFVTQLGPVHHQFVLVDEINRTSAKTQSALLEAMQERSVSIGGKTYDLPQPFVVMATQNPIEQEGTYTLPEAQLDRFLLKHIVSYPTLEEELQMMNIHTSVGRLDTVEPVLSVEKIRALQNILPQMYIDERVKKYIASVVQATRNPENFGLSDLKPMIQYGASPRASLALVAAGRAAAMIAGSVYVTPDHVKPFMYRVLRHRIGLTYEAEAENVTPEQVIDRIVGSVVVP